MNTNMPGFRCVFLDLCTPVLRKKEAALEGLSVSLYRITARTFFCCFNTCTSRILSMNVYPGGSLRYLGGAYVRYQNLKIPLKH